MYINFYIDMYIYDNILFCANTHISYIEKKIRLQNKHFFKTVISHKNCLLYFNKLDLSKYIINAS